jgi:diguanylate cyclase
MERGSTSDARLPVPVSPYGVLTGSALQVHELANTGRCHEALALAAGYEAAARGFGDETTVSFLIQSRMYAYSYLGRQAEATAEGHRLLERQRATGNLLGEAKTLSDVAQFGLISGNVAESMNFLARAGMLLDTTTRRNERYRSALVSYGTAANLAELYEIADDAFTRVADHNAAHGRAMGDHLEEIHMGLLLAWGIRLDQLGHTVEAGSRLRRAARLGSDWLRAHPAGDQEKVREVTASTALALAKLGHLDRVVAMVEPIIVALRNQQRKWAAWEGHLALGVARRGRADLTAARREFLAAQELCGDTDWPDALLLTQHELAVLAVETHGRQVCGDLVAAVRTRSRLLWQQRLQRLAMLRHARAREELQIAHSRTEAALLRDPLTGLGNRRRYDQLAADIDAGRLTPPVSLLVIDVDKFKTINDTYSHTAGDQVLRELGAILQAHCRAGQDTAIRYAGDEFVVFVGSDLAGAVEVAQRIRTAVATSVAFDPITPGSRVSISTGAAMLTPAMSAADLFRAADANLYQAKKNGRDRVAA